MAVTESGHLASRAIDDLYRAHGAEVYRYAYAVLGNHADAEDVTQTTFLNAYRALEQGVKPRKPSNWLLTIASNAIKQRFRQEQARPRQVELDDRIASPGVSHDDEGDDPTVGELLTALSKSPPQQRHALVLREFEGRSYAEIAEILGVTTSALETLLFRARRSLAEELQHQLTCTEAQLAISRSVDDRRGRKERRRLRDHLDECPDCARFARLQQRHRSALRGLTLVPIPISLTLFKGFEGTAAAAVVPMGAGAAAAGSAVAVGAGTTAAGSGGLLAGGVGVKIAAVVAAASVAGGVGVAGSSEIGSKPEKSKPATANGARLGQVAPRGMTVPGKGIAVGKTTAPGQTKAAGASNARATGKGLSKAQQGSANAKASAAKAKAKGQATSAVKRNAGAATKGSANRQTPSTATASKPKDTSAKGTTTKSQKGAAATTQPQAPAPEQQSSPQTAEPPVDDTTGGGAANGNGGGNGNAGGQKQP